MILKNVLIISILFFAACNNISNSEKTKVTTPSISNSDQELMNNAYQNLLLSTKMAEEALNRSTTPNAKDLAKSILNEHQQMMSKIEVVAGRHSVILPMDITPEQVKEWQFVVREKGIAFDKLYAQTVQDNHSINIRVFTLLRKANNQDLQALASNFISTSNQHIQQGTDLLQLLNSRKSRDTIAVIDDTIENQ